MEPEDDSGPLEMAKGVREEAQNAEAETARLAELRRETAVGPLASYIYVFSPYLASYFGYMNE